MPEEKLVPRIPPHSEEAEQSVLGCVLLDRDAAAKACENLVKEDFYNGRHQLIFEAISDMYHRHQEIDVVTLKNEMAHLGTLEQVGGLSYLTQISTLVPNTVNVEDYIKIVRDDSLYRRFISLGNEILTESYTTKTSIQDLSQHVEREVFSIQQNQNSRDFQILGDVLNDSLQEIQEAFQTKGQAGGIPTGFIDLDHLLSGLHPSDLIVIGARPSMGKSALGLNIVQYAAVHEKKKCAVFSLEMSGIQVANRMLASEAGVDLNKFRTGEMEQEDWDSLSDAVGTLSDVPVYIDDTGGITLSEVMAKCRRLKIEHGLDLVMIDYLQLMSGSGRTQDNRQQEISEISRGLKMLARELNVPVLALSQLGRGLENRSDHRPMMSDLRESGAIEQDADVVMFIYRDEYYHPENEEAHNIAEIIVSKQRNGPVGTIKLRYDGPYTRFSNLLQNGSAAPY